MPNRYDYVQYDDYASQIQAQFKAAFQNLETIIEDALPNGRATSLVHTKLEEAYMWVGKAIRDDQVARNGSAPLQEDRKNG